MKSVRGRRLQDFVEKRRRRNVGVALGDRHLPESEDTTDPWSWYHRFVGANTPAAQSTGHRGSRGIPNMAHPILNTARTPTAWNGAEDWVRCRARRPLSSPIPSVKILLTCHEPDGTGRNGPAPWVPEIRRHRATSRGGRILRGRRTLHVGVQGIARDRPHRRRSQVGRRRPLVRRIGDRRRGGGLWASSAVAECEDQAGQQDFGTDHFSATTAGLRSTVRTWRRSDRRQGAS